MTYPSMLCASVGMVQDSNIPLEPTASPSRITGGPGTKKEDICVCKKTATRWADPQYSCANSCRALTGVSQLNMRNICPLSCPIFSVCWVKHLRIFNLNILCIWWTDPLSVCTCRGGRCVWGLRGSAFRAEAWWIRLHTAVAFHWHSLRTHSSSGSKALG